jgi:hypothetical protein
MKEMEMDQGNRDRFEAARRMGEESTRAVRLEPSKLTPGLDAAVQDYLKASGTERAKAASPGAGKQLPKVGSWVASLGLDGDHPQVAKVRDAYRDSEGAGLLDLVLYGQDGTKLGRTSPAMGGPRGFEPCCCADWWVEIEAPPFELMAEARFGFRHLLTAKTA